MSKVSIFDQKWLDLVFEGRNKEYGAYQLRRQDSKTTLLALFSGIALMGALVSIPVILNQFKEKGEIVETPVLPDIIPIDSEKLFQPRVEKPKEPLAQQPAAPAPKPSVNTTRHVALVATSEPVEADPPTTVQLIETDPGQTTAAGTGQGIVIGPTSSDGPTEGTGTNTAGTGTSPGVINLALVDQAPAFPGGMNKFLGLVGEKFKTPDIGKTTTLKVLVSFVVEKDGSMSAIKVLRDPGNGLGEEAIRVLKSIKTKWKPGRKNGVDVRTAYSLPIVVNIR